MTRLSAFGPPSIGCVVRRGFEGCPMWPGRFCSPEFYDRFGVGNVRCIDGWFLDLCIGNVGVVNLFVSRYF